ncbi:MAG TPA: SRPBCC domain-containing protein [Baekduia sp.]
MSPIPDSIEREVLIEAPVDVVWGVVTEPAKIVQWFMDLAEIDLQPGGDGLFGMKDMRFPIVVQDVEAPTRFAFRWVHPEGEAPRAGNSTLVEFLLHAEGDATRLRVVESGLAEIAWTDAEKEKFLGEHERGWSEHLGDLVVYVAGRSETAASAAR